MDRRLQPRLSTEYLLAYFQLIRLPNLFTAAADSLFGFLAIQAGSWGFSPQTLVGVVAVSVFFYAAGVVLNDVADFDRDSRERPGRPLPSGRISRRWAAMLGIGAWLLGLGLCVGLSIKGLSPGMGLTGVGLGLTILVYNFLLKETFLGPILIGICRTLNVLLGMTLSGASMSEGGGLMTAHFLAAGAIGVYATGISCFARQEAGSSSRWSLALGVLLMLAGVAMVALLPWWAAEHFNRALLNLERWGLLIAVIAGIIGYRCAGAIIGPTPHQVQRATKQAILWIIVLDAAACLVFAGSLPAVLVLSLLLPAVVATVWISPT